MKKSLFLVMALAMTSQVFAASTTHNYPKTQNQYGLSSERVCQLRWANIKKANILICSPLCIFPSLAFLFKRSLP